MKNTLGCLLLVFSCFVAGCGKAETEKPSQSIVDQLDESASSEDVSKGIDAALEKYGEQK
jgi:hypothetical protein